MPYPFTSASAAVPFETLLNDVVVAANAKVQAGTGTRTITTAGVVATATVSFSPAYTTTPVVVTSAVSGNPDTRNATPTNVTTTGFTINCVNESSTTSVVYSWIALGS